jgi:hypothetical protein
MRSEIDEPEIPSGVSVFGNDGGSETLSMLYFDERKVARRYEARLQGQVLEWWRNTPAFSQRWTLTIGSDGSTMQGVGAMSKEAGPWGPDLHLTYTRMR